jgi:CDC45-like protein
MALQDNGDYYTVLLINCGACEDISALLNMRENVRVVVIDSHRPVHHSFNSSDMQQLLLQDPRDGTELDLIPEAGRSDDDGVAPRKTQSCASQYPRKARPANPQPWNQAS